MLLKLLAVAVVAVNVPGKTNKVPLKDIWAFRMGGTRDISKLDPRTRDRKETTIWKINEILVMDSSARKKAGPCFIAVGEGKQALKAAVEILSGDKKIPRTLPSDKPLALFFYSQCAPGYVVIHSIERDDSEMTVNYKIVTHATADASTHFALIPLGHLPEGTFKVNVNEVAPPKPYKNKSLAERAVCDSNTFTIEKVKEP